MQALVRGHLARLKFKELTKYKRDPKYLKFKMVLFKT